MKTLKNISIGILYKDIDEKGGYTRDILRLYDELLDKNIQVYKLKTFSDFLKYKNRLDIVHIFSIFMPISSLVALYCCIFKIPYIVTTFSHLLPYAMKKKYLKKYLFFIIIGRFLLNNAKTVHAFAEYEKKSLINLGITAKIDKISLGIYPEDLNSMILESNIKLIDENYQPYIIFLGRLDIFQKGIDILIDGFKEYTQISEKYKLIICGKDWQNGSNFIKDRLINQKINNRILFLGEISEEEKDSLIENADALIYPSRFDGPPRPIRFAIAKKQKILVSYQSNIVDCLEENGWGLQFDANSKAICNGILEFENRVIWTKYKDPLEILSWNNLVYKYIDMYENSLI